MPSPTVLLFDVNETLLDIEALTPLFTRVFGDGRVMREWYAQLVIYSQTAAFCGRYVPFGTLGAGVMRMLGTIKGREVAEEDLAALAMETRSLPAHPGVPKALGRLREAGFRLATLTNSAPTDPPTPLEKAGLATFLERSFSVEAVGCFKPAPACYSHAAHSLGVEAEAIGMVATHVWDLLGAQAVGCRTALVTWADNAPLPVDGLPQPDLAAPTMLELADHIIRHWR